MNTKMMFTTKSILLATLFSLFSSLVSAAHRISYPRPKLPEYQVVSASVHAWLMIVSWGLFVDLGIIVARYLRTMKYYVLVHVTFLGLTFVMTMVGVPYATWAYGGLTFLKRMIAKKNMALSYHIIVGFIVFAFMIAESLLGLYNWYLLRRKDSLGQHYRKPIKTHKYFGWFTYVLAKSVCISGVIFYYGTAEWLGAWMATQGFLVSVMIYLEFFRTKSLSETKKHFLLKTPKTAALAPAVATTISEKTAHLKLFEMLRQGKTRTEIMAVLPNLLWVILDNNVYDLGKDFSHPGGDYIVKAVVGREVSRFLYGSAGLEEIPNSQYRHSADTFTLLEKCYIGSLEYKSFVQYEESPDTSPKKVNFSNLDTESPINGKSKVRAKDLEAGKLFPSAAPTKGSSLWTLAEQEKISATTYKVFFETENARLNLVPLDVSYFGRHFKITHSENKNVRFYTVCLQQSKEYINLATSLYDTYIKLMEKKEKVESISAIVAPQSTDTLPMVIKKYQKKSFGNKKWSSTFSSYLEGCTAGTSSFQIDGPLGRGMELSKQTDGKQTIIAGGTGLIPFLDLIFFLYRKTIYHVVQKNVGQEAADKLNVYNEDFDHTFGSNFSVELIGYFGCPADLIGMDLIQKLSQLCAKHEMNTFSVQMRFADNARVEGFSQLKNKIDEELVKSVCATSERVYLCGPPGFNKKVIKVAIKESLGGMIVLV